MFTGIIKEIGTIAEISQTGTGTRIACKADIVLKEVKKGDSIAVNGVCLTVIYFSFELFEADVSPETMERSNLTLLKPGDKCNLEPALRAGEPFGGHFVMGHIDGTGKILTVMAKGNSHFIKISASGKLMKYIASKGSIAIDGVSLTPFNCTDKNFDVSVIPHTREKTTLNDIQPGALVNIECDIISKYIEQLIDFRKSEQDKKTDSKIDKKYLREKGFLY
ncbi:MAG: riboflavin synthase [Spirochaetales bacterium]|nr:riboflavin synthase [Spirochaetales bacterium]